MATEPFSLALTTTTPQYLFLHGFVYGYADSARTRVHYDLDEGFRQFDPPFTHESTARGQISSFVSECVGDGR